MGGHSVWVIKDLKREIIICCTLLCTSVLFISLQSKGIHLFILWCYGQDPAVEVSTWLQCIQQCCHCQKLMSRPALNSTCGWVFTVIWLLRPQQWPSYSQLHRCCFFCHCVCLFLFFFCCFIDFFLCVSVVIEEMLDSLLKNYILYKFEMNWGFKIVGWFRSAAIASAWTIF